MTVSVVDAVLGSLVLCLAGWALFQTSTKRSGGGGCGGCGGGSCGPSAPQGEEEDLVRLPRRDDDVR